MLAVKGGQFWVNSSPIHMGQTVNLSLDSLQAGFFFEESSLVCALPCESRLVPPEVAVRGGCLVNRPQQLQMIDDAAWCHREVPADQLVDNIDIHILRVLGVDENGHRLRNTDRIGQLYLALLGQSSGNDVPSDATC